MNRRRKKLSEQVLVVTGASSGIGLVTALRAASRGARVVLAARNARDLEAAVERIRAAGGRAIAVPTDTSEPDEVEALGERAIDAYGGFDTWINAAAVSMYGRLWEIPLEDARRQLDVDFWGYVHGSLAAVSHFRERGEGGLVQVTSALADRAIPLQGYYCAAKHAVSAFTDTLRMEVEAAGLGISVSQVKPGSIDTPFFEKARTYFDREPRPVPPVYAPEVVADVVLACCERPRRDVVVTGMGKLLAASDVIAPRLTDLYLERRGMEPMQLSEIPVAPDRRDNLYEPVADDGGERGHTWTGRTRESSLTTRLLLHGPAIGAAIVGGVALAWAAGLAARWLGPSRGPLEAPPPRQEELPFDEGLPVVPT